MEATCVCYNSILKTLESKIGSLIHSNMKINFKILDLCGAN